MSVSILLILFLRLLNNVQCTSVTIPNMKWEKLSSTSGPSPRSNFAYGYDWRRKNIYIFGGRSSSNSPLADTWIYSITDNSWTQISLKTYPSARAEMVFGMDQPPGQERDSLVIYGGSGSQSTGLSDAWYFDLNFNKWALLNVTGGGGPGPVVGGSGGIDGSSSQPEKLLWVAQGFPSEEANQANSAAYALKITGSLFAGSGTISSSWNKVTLPQDLPAVGGVGSTLVPGFRLVTYGGQPSVISSAWPSREGSIVTVDASTFKGNSPTKTADCVSGRFYPAMCSFPGTERYALMYGGIPAALAGGEDGQVDVLNTDSGEWVSVVPPLVTTTSGYPSLRSGSALIATNENSNVNGTNKRIFLFGGVDNSGNALNDLWVLHISNTISTVDLTTSMASFGKLVQCTAPPTTQAPIDSTPQVTYLLLLHAGLLSVAIILLLPFITTLFIISAYSPDFEKQYPRWTQWAVFLFFLSTILSLVGASYGASLSSTHFNSNHGRMGLVILVVFQILLPGGLGICWLVSKYRKLKQTRKEKGLTHSSADNPFLSTTPDSTQPNSKRSSARSDSSQPNSSDSHFLPHEVISEKLNTTYDYHQKKDPTSGDAAFSCTSPILAALEEFPHCTKPSAPISNKWHFNVFLCIHHVVLVLGFICCIIAFSEFSYNNGFLSSQLPFVMGGIFGVYVLAWILMSFLCYFKSSSTKKDANGSVSNESSPPPVEHHPTSNVNEHYRKSILHTYLEQEETPVEEGQEEITLQDREVVVMTVPKRTLKVVNSE